jgi:hypothetical protein
MVLEFMNGARVAEAFAEASMAFTFPEPHGLFLVREWLINQSGELIEEVPGTRGLLIPNIDQVCYIRIQESPESA